MLCAMCLCVVLIKKKKVIVHQTLARRSAVICAMICAAFRDVAYAEDLSTSMCLILNDDAIQMMATACSHDKQLRRIVCTPVKIRPS